MVLDTIHVVDNLFLKFFPNDLFLSCTFFDISTETPLNGLTNGQTYTQTDWKTNKPTYRIPFLRGKKQQTPKYPH